MSLIEFKRKDKTVVEDNTESEISHWWLISYTFIDKDNSIGIGTMYYYNTEFVDTFHKFNQEALYEMVIKNLPEGFRKYIVSGISYLGVGTKSTMVLER